MFYALVAVALVLWFRELADCRGVKVFKVMCEFCNKCY